MLDKIDRKILDTLQQRGRISNLDLAECVNLSATACQNRVKKLEKSGVISGYSAVIDPSTLGFTMSALVLLKTGNHTREAWDEITQAFKGLRSITACYMTTGKIDFVAHIYAKDFEDYERILTNELGKVPHIVSMETIFLMSNMKTSAAFPINSQRLTLI